ncbi:predicted protein [Histoplasma capsulatum H143]|uniref:Uncharacterized protein n=1 Tax=Ajellomyces capsulatus (strain H143) TaxID=544712 RepID=C6H3S8_AJECH|nr:predicted protein [Histoplasma capsulatum H143]
MHTRRVRPRSFALPLRAYASRTSFAIRIRYGLCNLAAVVIGAFVGKKGQAIFEKHSRIPQRQGWQVSTCWRCCAVCCVACCVWRPRRARDFWQCEIGYCRVRLCAMPRPRSGGPVGSGKDLSFISHFGAMTDDGEHEWHS